MAEESPVEATTTPESAASAPPAIDPAPSPASSESTPVPAAAFTPPRTTADFASPHRFSKEAEALSRDFKALLQSHGWVSLGNNKGVDISKKEVPGSALGILKGEGIIEGFSSREIFPVTQLPGCRVIWDDMFESGKGLEVLDKICILSYATTKSQGFVSSRDLVVLVLNELLDDGRIFSMSKSVVDPSAPEVKGRVRATLKILGWAFEPLPDRLATKVTYITEIDLGGWIPGNILKLAASQIPLVVAAVRRYLNKFHPISFPIVLGGSTASTPEFHHESSKLDYEFEVDNRISPFTELYIPQKRYPHGVTIKITPAEGLEFEVNEKQNLVIKHGKDELNGKKIRLLVEKNSSGKHITVNGAKLSPLGATSSEDAPTAAGAPAREGVAVVTMETGGGGDVNALLEETRRKLAEIERLARIPHKSSNVEKLGAAFLVITPMVAYFLASLA